MKNIRHFLKETDFSKEEVDHIFSLADKLKKNRANPQIRSLNNQSWGLLFFKNSTRTRISFDVGVNELGGHGIYLDQKSLQISRGESVADTAKVVSRYLHGLVIRAFEHSLVEEFAAEGSIPVINALTDFLHPCQIYTDAFTLAENWKSGEVPCLEDLKGKKLVFMGDCDSNMANSWILGGCLFGMEVVMYGPKEFQPGEEIKKLVESSNLDGSYTFTTDVKSACCEADVIYTDVWVSMGDESEAAKRKELLSPYQVNLNAFKMAKGDALFMHCLPAHEGEEVSADVLALPNSIIFDQAENRLHVQKAIMAKLVE